MQATSEIESESLRARLACRSGHHTRPTANVAPGYVQGNLVVLPQSLAAAFEKFCELNPKPCPLVGMSEPGSPHIASLGADLDVRTDLPRYRVWRNGTLVEQPTDIVAHWRNDLVAFVLGCSFSFEDALLCDGLRIRHIERGCNVPMYRTNVPCEPAGPFAGPLVVSMRPFRPADAARAAKITARYPRVHGAPVQIGDPASLGIADIGKPDYGDAVDIAADEVPVFWACGVTPQSIILESKPEFAITHAPGCMLVTDRRNAEFAVS
jgi:uncharacterized protein YcsI (UPF0317 family)